MSLFRTIEATCPSCQVPGHFDLVHSVNADRRPALREEILKRTFQQSTCPACGEIFRIAPELTYVHQAGGLWLSDADFLPVRHVSVPPAWQFGVAYPLPAALVNHAFTGWGGHATVGWPRRGLSMTVAADADAYVLFTPPGKDFFCFEPVDHPINAVNLPGGGAAHGMTLLAPGERLTRRFSFTVERADARVDAAAREGRRRRG